MGYTIRTDEWRYTEWPRWKCYDTNVCDDAADWDDLAGRELYSHIGDIGACFDCFENENVADDPKYAKLVS